MIVLINIKKTGKYIYILSKKTGKKISEHNWNKLLLWQFLNWWYDKIFFLIICKLIIINSKLWDGYYSLVVSIYRKCYILRLYIFMIYVYIF